MRGTLHIPSVYVIVRSGNKMLFVLRTNTGYKDNTYCLPSGHVEAGESYIAAAIRETLEEVGLVLKPEHLRHAYTMQRYQTPEDIRVDIFFEADQWEGEAKNMEPERHGEIAWFDVTNLPYDKIMDYQADVLQRIAKGERYSEIGWLPATR